VVFLFPLRDSLLYVFFVYVGRAFVIEVFVFEIVIVVFGHFELVILLLRNRRPGGLIVIVRLLRHGNNLRRGRTQDRCPAFALSPSIAPARQAGVWDGLEIAGTDQQEV
jgi:hypothetical protein